MTINLHLPSHSETLKPKITVVGVGGAGGNAVNNMIAANLEGVDFVMANTDAQALESAMTDRTIQLGMSVTRGLGAGASPQIGQAAAEEALDEIADYINGSNMVFITAGMGGGTGTGAAPVIAQLARQQGILTVGVVTKPFQFEGTHRMRIADRGIEELQQYVDTLIVIPNQNLFRIANEKTTFADAFRMADEVLHSGVRGVTDLMVKPGLVNLDFADIRAVMSEMGKAMMGTGEAEGDKRAIDAAESAISNPLLDDVSLRGARAVLINITGGPDMTLFEVDEAANRIRDEVDPEANIIFGSTFSDSMEGKMRVSVVATGIDAAATAASITSHRSQSAAMSQPRPMENVAREARQPKPFNIIPPKQEMKQERSPAEIVRQAGSASAYDIARMANERIMGQPQQQATALQEPVVRVKQTQQEETLFVQEQGQLAIDVPGEDRRRPFKLGEVKDQFGDGPLFMSPKPEQPAQRTHFAAQQPEIDEAVAEEEQEGTAFNFFTRIAGVGKALSGKVEAAHQAASPRERMVQQGGAAAVVKDSPLTEENDDYLDIPAFLRRQAN